jgi:hypothetical protein
MMFTVSRPPATWSSVASCRASCGGQLSPTRTAASSRMRVVSAAMAAAKAVVSIPSAYPDGSRMLSKPFRSARSTRSRQCSQLDASAGSGTPKNS